MRSLLTVLIILSPITIHALDTSHFVNYYPFYSRALSGADARCTTSHRYFDANPTPDTCKSYTNCLTKELDDINKADMASAAVLLGLAPSLLGMVGPNIAEISLLSSRRPILSFLLAMNAPALNIGSLFEFQSPVQALMERRRKLIAGHNNPTPELGSHMLIVGLQYIFLLASIANIVTNSIELGAWTVVSWKCKATYMPALWICLPFLTWLAALISFKLYKPNAGYSEDVDSICTSTGRDTASHQKRRWWQNEFSTCKHRPYTLEVHPDKDSILAHAFNALAWLCVYISLWFGTLVLSSLLFIGTLDAFTVIMRYFASAIVSRFVLWYELGGISWKETVRPIKHATV